MVAERDGVMVGRPEIASYALFPEDGAEVLRLLSSGRSLAEVTAWYEQACGESLDVDDFLAVLEDLQFILPDGEEEPAPVPVRWQRLGRWTFSPLAWLVYGGLMVAAIVAMIHQPALRPSYRQLFFTDYLALIPVALTTAIVPAILLHESFHALAGRRLGLPSTLSIGRRLYYLVAETRLDSLFSVPRRKRYLPFLAGILADAVLISVLTLTAAGLRGHAPAWFGGLCLAVAFTCVLRLIWQFMFYLETDLYFVFTHALGCADLQNATRFYLKTRLRRLLHRRTSADRRRVVRPGPGGGSLVRTAVGRPVTASRWAASIWAGIPATMRFWSLIFHRFTDGGLRRPVVSWTP